MQVQLISISPISFMIAKEGGLVKIQHKAPRPNEYREKIGPASECYLVFKGQAKLGMIPKEIATHYKEFLIRKSCRITKIDQENKVFMVELTDNQASQGKNEIQSS